MDTEAAFLEDIAAAPLDDVPRLIYADWLQDQDDPVRAARGEFIRAQIEADRLQAAGTDLDTWAELAARAGRLQTEYQARWLGKVCSPRIRWVFKRGFLAALGDEGLWDEGDATYRYLARFYDDGTVVSDSSSEPLAALWDKFDRHDRHLGRGAYTLGWTPAGIRVAFQALSASGRIDYDGTIKGRTMRLKWYSHINQNSGSETYHLHLPG